MAVPLFPARLPRRAVPSRIREPHTFWTLGGRSLLCCCASCDFHPGVSSLLPTPPHPTMPRPQEPHGLRLLSLGASLKSR